MSLRFALGWSLLALGAAMAWLLMAGGTGMTLPLFGIPRGNLVASILVSAAPLALLAFEGGSARFRQMASGLALAALLWFPISLILAGNRFFSFRDGRFFTAWIAYTAVLLLFGAGMLVARVFQRLMAAR